MPGQTAQPALMRLQDKIRIKSTPERVFAWLEAMPEKYESWHPDHVSCRVIGGSMSQVGSEFEFREYLHGKLHSMRIKLMRIDPGGRMEYRIASLGKGAFQVNPAGNETEFVAELDIGPDAPVIGWLVDAVLLTFFRGRLKAMRRHMREEGRSLKRILEAGQHG